ncbi:hypothetical protein LTR53_018311, partial [Teratosphaeriaceae sp. CCFEE 6253]
RPQCGPGAPALPLQQLRTIPHRRLPTRLPAQHLRHSPRPHRHRCTARSTDAERRDSVLARRRARLQRPRLLRPLRPRPGRVGGRGVRDGVYRWSDHLGAGLSAWE